MSNNQDSNLEKKLETFEAWRRYKNVIPIQKILEMSSKLVHNLYFLFISRARNVRIEARPDRHEYEQDLKKLTLKSVK